MNRIGFHIALWLTGLTIVLCVPVSPVVSSAPMSAVVDHAVVPFSGPQDLPERPVAVITVKRRVVHRTDTNPQGTFVPVRLQPESRPQYGAAECVVYPFSPYVFIIYLPRDPPRV